MTQKRQKILVVEDEAIIALNIKKILDKAGFDTYIDCFTVNQALKLLKEISPDLIIIDINLKSEQTGIDLARELLKKDEIPFMYLTSYSDLATLEKAKGTRPYGYLVKPFKAEDLISTVFIIINNYRYRNVDVARKEESDPVNSPYRIKKVLDYINDHIHEKIEITKLAEFTQWEPEHFSRVFKEFIQLTPYQYILKRKIEFARGMLVETGETLQNISNALGFDSYSNFYKAFKKYTQLTPAKYRAIHRTIQ
jgi:YesN/AraC family two-component response regulator